MFTEILTIVSDYGWIAIVAIFALFTIYKLTVMLVTNKLKNFSFFSSTKVDNTIDLKLHIFFRNAEYRMVVEIPNLELMPSKPVKQQMFRDLIYIETKTIFDVCNEIAKFDMKDWSEERWVSEMSEKVNLIISKFIQKCKDEGIPDVVIQKYIKWHNSSFEMLHEYIGTLGGSLIYLNNTARTNTVFLIMNLMLVNTLADAERSLKELNGDISGKIYKNMIIEP